MNVYIVIPLFSDGIEINHNDVAAFSSYEAASEYASKNQFSYYSISTTTLNS